MECICVFPCGRQKCIKFAFDYQCVLTVWPASILLFIDLCLSDLWLCLPEVLFRTVMFSGAPEQWRSAGALSHCSVRVGSEKDSYLGVF